MPSPVRAPLVVAILFAACGGSAPAAPTASATAIVAAPPSAGPVSFVPVSTPNPNASPTRASRIVTFRDATTGSAITIEVAPNAIDRGHFFIQIPKGGYGGDAAVRATLSSPGAPIAVTYDGPMDFTDASSGKTRSITVSLRGTIDPDAHAGDIVFVADSARYVITARPPDPGVIAPVLDRLEAALVADDAAAIYALSSQQIKAGFSKPDFVAAWQAQAVATGRRITAMRRVAVGAVVESDAGFASVEVRWSTDITDRNGSRAIGLTGLLIFEDREWKLWTTSES